MNEKAAVMKREIHAIAKYRAIMLSKYYLAFILGLTSLYLSFKHYVPSSLYILLVLYILPPILTFAIKDYSNGNQIIFQSLSKDNPFLLKNLQKKYQYTNLNYTVNSISYFIVIMLLCLWQFKYNNTDNMNIILSKIPILIMATGLTIRYLLVILYAIILRHDLLNNKI